MMKDEIKKPRVKREPPSFNKVVAIITDILIYPIVIIALAACFSLLVVNKTKMLPSLAGYSVVKILSGSMIEAGYEIGDVLFVKTIKSDRVLNVGDDVAFYNVKDSADTNLINTLVPLSEWDGNISGSAPKNRRTKQFYKDNDYSVYFHRICAIKVSPVDGTIFYDIVGSTPGDKPDTIRADLVIGEYVNTPREVRDFFKFCASKNGIIFLALLPLSILIILECFSILEQINAIILENKVFFREIAFDCPESIKANIMIDMDLHRKIVFYVTTPEREKSRVAYHMWEYTGQSTKKKDIALYKKVNVALELEKSSEQQYFDFWFANLGSYQKRKLEKLKRQYDYERSLKTVLKDEKIGKTKY